MAVTAFRVKLDVDEETRARWHAAAERIDYERLDVWASDTLDAASDPESGQVVGVETIGDPERVEFRARLTTAETVVVEARAEASAMRRAVRKADELLKEAWGREEKLGEIALAAEARVEAAERECGQLHGWYSDAQKQVEALREAVGIFLDACGLAEPLDEFHPDVLVFNETPTVHLRTACRVARAALACPPQQESAGEALSQTLNERQAPRL